MSAQTAAEEVSSYLERHNVKRRVEDAINAAVKAKALNPLEFIAEELKAPSERSSHEPDPDIVHIARSQPRDWRTGAICFDITYDNEVTRRVPIDRLMDLKDKTIEFDEVTNAINDWIDVANKHPHPRRHCICCRSRATPGKILCKKCDTRVGETVYA